MEKFKLFSVKRIAFPFYCIPMFFSQNTFSQTNFESDLFKTSIGELHMYFIGHGSLMFKLNDLVIHIDPTMHEADYSAMPKADVILVTHEHYDHMDITAINHIKKENTQIIITEKCMENAEGLTNAFIMKNGDELVLHEIKIEAVPAYNIKHTRSPGKPFHPKGDGNGYVLNIGDKRIYIAGDTENTEEMKALQNIDIAFLPMNLPYTMTPEMVADAAKAFKPKILYPYHYGQTNTNKLIELLKNDTYIEVRIRQLQ